VSDTGERALSPHGSDRIILPPIFIVVVVVLVIVIVIVLVIVVVARIVAVILPINRRKVIHGRRRWNRDNSRKRGNRRIRVDTVV
jgi:Flp pilus assembly protein TadB